MKKWIRITIGAWAIVLIAVDGGISQGVPGKPLENGNAFLYQGTRSFSPMWNPTSVSHGDTP